MNRTEMIFQIQRNIKKKNPYMEIPKNQIGLQEIKGKDRFDSKIIAKYRSR